MKHHYLIESINNRLTSGNSIPVERCMVSREEVDMLVTDIDGSYDNIPESLMCRYNSDGESGRKFHMTSCEWDEIFILLKE